MTGSWRLAVGLAAWLVAGIAGSADAQTIVLRHANPATAAEVVLGPGMGKGVVEPNGDVTVRLSEFPANIEEVSATVNVDRCGETIRVVLVDRTDETPAASAGCQRQLLPGFYVLRRNTSLLIDLEPSTPVVRIRQGPIPAVWFLDGPIPTGRTAPRGIVVHGGGGLGRMPDTLFRLCGNALSCTRENTKIDLRFGAAYWLTRWLGMEGAVIRLSPVTADGFDTTYEFTGRIAPRMATVSALGGLNVKATRFYGRLGAAYHRADVRTSQVTYSRTIDIGDDVVTFPGAEQRFLFSTSGWGPIVGGGVEGWVGDKTALFADLSFIEIKGENANDDGSVRQIEERPMVFSAGLMIHFGFRR